jgi:hypothetical protein
MVIIEIKHYSFVMPRLNVVLSRQENYNPNPKEVGPGSDADDVLVAKSAEVCKVVKVIIVYGSKLDYFVFYFLVVCCDL